MASENWLDPEWGTSGLSGFNSSRISKIATSPGLANGLDMMEMTKELVQEMYEAKRPDDGISGTRVGIVIHSEVRGLDTIKDPVMSEIAITTDEITKITGVLVVYVAPAGGSCSMLPRPSGPNDKASIYRFPRFYSISGELESPIVGRPCEVSYLDEDTLSFGLYHGMIDSAPQSQAEDFLYRNESSRQVAQKAFGSRSKLVKDLTLFDRATSVASLAGKSYHTSVLASTNFPFGETGGGRITNNVELNYRRDGAATLASEGWKGRIHKVEKNTYLAYKAMVEQATKDGIAAPLLQIRSGYRSVSLQRKLWKDGLKDPKTRKRARDLGISLEAALRKFVAPPGSSRHHSGRALDFHLGFPCNSSNVSKMKATPVYVWLLDNAEFYGFYNYKAEPWHWEFNPDARTARIAKK